MFVSVTVWCVVWEMEFTQSVVSLFGFDSMRIWSCKVLGILMTCLGISASEAYLDEEDVEECQG